MAQVREAFTIRAERRLIRDLKRLGATDETLERWLGYRLNAPMHPEDMKLLEDYVEYAEEELRKGRKSAPPLPRRMR